MTAELDGTRIPYGPHDFPSDHVPAPRMYNHNRQSSFPLAVSRSSTLSTDMSISAPPPSFAESMWGLDESETSSFLPKYGSLPPEQLALTPKPTCLSRIFISGGTRTPDLTASTDDDEKLYRFETDSTLVYHETYVKDLAAQRSLFTIRRRPVQDKPDGTWRYTIHTNLGTRGRRVNGGTKILEIDTDPGMMLGGRNKSWSTRLIFRNANTAELDGLTLSVTHEGLTGTGMTGEVLYQGKKVADIVDRQRREPSYEIRIFRDGLDALLVMMLAYVMDDRVMGSKRRNRRSAMAGVPGIGKGPGAGLAGAYGLGALI